MTSFHSDNKNNVVFFKWIQPSSHIKGCKHGDVKGIPVHNDKPETPAGDLLGLPQDMWCKIFEFMSVPYEHDFGSDPDDNDLRARQFSRYWGLRDKYSLENSNPARNGYSLFRAIPGLYKRLRLEPCFMDAWMRMRGAYIVFLTTAHTTMLEERREELSCARYDHGWYGNRVDHFYCGRHFQNVIERYEHSFALYKKKIAIAKHGMDE